MTCEDSKITLEFFDLDGNSLFEIRPLSMQFDRDDGDFDFLRAKFSQPVVELFQDNRGSGYGPLDNMLPVHVKFDGMDVHRMLYMPDGVTYGVEHLHLELHDILKYMTRGVVDFRSESVTLEDAFEEVFEMRDTTGPAMFEGIRFHSTGTTREIIAEDSSDGSMHDREAYLNSRDNIGQWAVGETISTHFWGDGREEYENNHGIKIVDGNYAIDLEHVSPWKAMHELALKFGVDIWSEPDGMIYVGIRGGTDVSHFAAPDDRRVWKMHDFNVSPPRDPIVKCIVRGKFLDDPNEGLIEDGAEFLNWNRGMEDYHMEGVAEIEGADYGDVIGPFEVEAAKDSLESLAATKLLQEQRNQWSGNIELLPSHSGDKWSDIRTVQIGDMITTVPPDDEGDSSCKSNILMETFSINGVHHTLTDDGKWKLRVNVTPAQSGYIGSQDITTHLRKYDPHNEEMMDVKKAYGP